MAAQMNPANSRAMATTTLGRGLPLPSIRVKRRWSRVHGLVGESDDFGGLALPAALQA